jgi:hypothetical protein
LVDVGFVWPAVAVEEVDRVVAAVAGEMPVVAASAQLQLGGLPKMGRRWHWLPAAEAGSTSSREE